MILLFLSVHDHWHFDAVAVSSCLAGMGIIIVLPCLVRTRCEQEGCARHEPTRLAEKVRKIFKSDRIPQEMSKCVICRQNAAFCSEHPGIILGAVHLCGGRPCKDFDLGLSASHCRILRPLD